MLVERPSAAFNRAVEACSRAAGKRSSTWTLWYDVWHQVLLHLELTTDLDAILEEILDLVLGTESDLAEFRGLMDMLPSSEQRMVLDAALRMLSKRYLSKISVNCDRDWWKADTSLISGAAAYLNNIVLNDDARRAHLLSWLTSLSGAGTGDAVGVRRAAIAVFSNSKNEMESILEKSLQQFGDQLYIKHTPTLQQEGI
jgi:telomere length regulation protein